MMHDKENTIVYVVSHKDFTMPQLSNYVPILAGASKNNSSIQPKDNTGDNISDKNDSYCELTAQYWVWKNTEEGNVGFVHYRRFFYESYNKKNIVSANQFSADLCDYDLILPEPDLFMDDIQIQYSKIHNSNDLLIIRDVIDHIYPQYIESFDTLMKSHTMSCYNMFVMPRSMYRQYMNWLFQILSEVEKRIDISTYDNYNKRIFGFISERLINVWVMKNKYKIKYYPVYRNDEIWWKKRFKTIVKNIII